MNPMLNIASKNLGSQHNLLSCSMYMSQTNWLYTVSLYYIYLIVPKFLLLLRCFPKIVPPFAIPSATGFPECLPSNHWDFQEWHQLTWHGATLSVQWTELIWLKQHKTRTTSNQLAGGWLWGYTKYILCMYRCFYVCLSYICVIYIYIYLYTVLISFICMHLQKPQNVNIKSLSCNVSISQLLAILVHQHGELLCHFPDLVTCGSFGLPPHPVTNKGL